MAVVYQYLQRRIIRHYAYSENQSNAIQSSIQSTKGVSVTSVISRKLTVLFALSATFLTACGAGPTKVTTTIELAEAADAPYENVLVIFLAESFDSRRYLETEIVKSLAENGTKAVRSTTIMNTKTPVTRQTFVEMVDEIDADAVLVTQIADLQTTGEVVNMNPQATYNIRPTYYYNVWSVDLQEYREPKAIDYEHKLSLATQMLSVRAEDVVWAIESNSDIIESFDDGPDYSIYIKEAKAIVNSLAKGGLIE
jgi:hypothetical protein